MRILIITPDLKRLGGVANHYLGLDLYWQNEIKYQFYGKRNNLPAFILLPYDLFTFILRIIFFKPNFIIVNPSFRPYQIIRDGIFLLIANALGKKTITFFHGWDNEFAKKIIATPKIFKFVYNKSFFIYILYSDFKKQLLKMGITIPIKLTTTKVDDSYLKNFNIQNRDGNIHNVLFLARIEKYKGIYEAIEIFKQLSKNYPHLQYSIVGSGSELGKVKNKVENWNLNNIDFKGALSGNDLIAQFKKADVYIFPSYAEGMPTSVLEAMAFGLPVLSNAVGGLNDFFENDKMGFLIEPFAIESYVNKMDFLLSNPEKTKAISHYNHNYSKKNFLASSVAGKIEHDIKLT